MSRGQQGGFPCMWKDRNASKGRQLGQPRQRWRFFGRCQAQILRKISRWHVRRLYWILDDDDSDARAGNFVCFPYTCHLLGWTMKERFEYWNYERWTSLFTLTILYLVSLTLSFGFDFPMFPSYIRIQAILFSINFPSFRHHALFAFPRFHYPGTVIIVSLD